MIKKLFLCALLALSTTAIARTMTVDQDTLVTQSLQSLMRKDAVPGAAVLLYVQGKPYRYFFGYANKETRTPVTGNTIFELGSISKTFMGLLLCLEVKKGHLHLEDHAVNFLDRTQTYSKSFQKITLKQLAAFTSSLPFNAPAMTFNPKSNTRNEAILARFLRTWRAPYPIGTHWAYSNLSFGLLGNVLARQAHMRLINLVQQEILNPLHMYHTDLEPSIVIERHYAQGYAADNAHSPISPGGLLAGAWAIRASGDDMLIYLHAALRLSSTPPQIKDAMTRAQTPYFAFAGKEQGLGWTIYPLASISIYRLLHSQGTFSIGPIPAYKTGGGYFRTNALIEKTGATNGFRTYIGLIPSTQTGVVILLNRFIPIADAVNVGRKIIFSLGAPA